MINQLINKRINEKFWKIGNIVRVSNNRQNDKSTSEETEEERTELLQRWHETKMEKFLSLE